MSVAATDPRAILGALVTQMQSIDGTGSYHYDLSGSVYIDSPTEPPTAWPCCVVEPGPLIVDDGPAGRVPLGQARCTFDAVLYAFVGVSSSGGSESVLESYDALMDLARAYRSDRTIGGTVHLSRIIDSGTVQGSDADALGTGRAVAVLRIQVEWTRSLA